MRGYSKVVIIGNLTKDPELRYISSGMAVGNFTVAINKSFKTQTGETKEEVSFIPIIVWGKTAENCNQYLKKGSPVFVEGELKQESWNDKDGQKRSAIKINASTVQFLGQGKATESSVPSEEEVPF